MIAISQVLRKFDVNVFEGISAKDIASKAKFCCYDVIDSSTVGNCDKSIIDFDGRLFVVCSRSELLLSDRHRLRHRQACGFNPGMRHRAYKWHLPEKSIRLCPIRKPPQTTVIDARTIEEMQKVGYFNASTCRFLHAHATKTEDPLLQLAAKSFLPQKDAPVVIYCGSGIRATTAKQVLEEAGYTNVLNAGGLPDIHSLAKV